MFYTKARGRFVEPGFENQGFTFCINPLDNKLDSAI
jgi:hypothetical protein